jgi:hypothetical protein
MTAGSAASGLTAASEPHVRVCPTHKEEIMNGEPLSRHAGPIVLTAGAYIAITHLALLFVYNPDDLLSTLANPLFRIVSIAYAAAFAGLLVALFAAYARQAREAGKFGLVALFAAILGTFTLGADMWFEAFATPWLVEIAPQVINAERATIWVIGYFSSYILFAVGWALFGLASLRARVFPLPVNVALVLGGLIGFLAAGPPFSVPLGLALMWLGVWLIKTARVHATIPNSATALGT